MMLGQGSRQQTHMLMTDMMKIPKIIPILIATKIQIPQVITTVLASLRPSCPRLPPFLIIRLQPPSPKPSTIHLVILAPPDSLTLPL